MLLVALCVALLLVNSTKLEMPLLLLLLLPLGVVFIGDDINGESNL